MDAEPRAPPSRGRARQHLRDEDGFAPAAWELQQHAAAALLHRGAALGDQVGLVGTENKTHTQARILSAIHAAEPFT